jgi:hypothetical protein
MLLRKVFLRFRDMGAEAIRMVIHDVSHGAGQDQAHLLDVGHIMQCT